MCGEVVELRTRIFRPSLGIAGAEPADRARDLLLLQRVLSGMRRL